jgi:hypothetical protein
MREPHRCRRSSRNQQYSAGRENPPPATARAGRVRLLGFGGEIDHVIRLRVYSASRKKTGPRCPIARLIKTSPRHA